MYMPVETSTPRLSIIGIRTISLAAAVASLLISMRVFLGEDSSTGLERLLKTLPPRSYSPCYANVYDHAGTYCTAHLLQDMWHVLRSVSWFL